MFRQRFIGEIHTTFGSGGFVCSFPERKLAQKKHLTHQKDNWDTLFMDINNIPYLQWNCVSVSPAWTSVSYTEVHETSSGVMISDLMSIVPALPLHPYTNSMHGPPIGVQAIWLEPGCNRFPSSLICTASLSTQVCVAGCLPTHITSLPASLNAKLLSR